MLKLGYRKHGRHYCHGLEYWRRIYHFIHNDTKIGQFQIEYRDDCYWIWNFNIKFPYRNCGYGHKMLQECIKTLNDKPLQCYSATDGPMLHLLQKYNFVIIKVEDLGDVYRNVSCYQMRREVK